MPMNARSKRIATRFVAYGVVAIAATAAFDLLFLQSRIPVPLAVLIAAAGITAAVIIGAGGLFMAALDDRQRSLRYTCWYWGSLFGLLFGALAIVAASRTGIYPNFFSRRGFGGGLSAGVLTIAAAQLVGYYGARLAWWSMHRAPSHEE